MPKSNRKRGLPPIINPPTGLTSELLAIYESWPKRFATKVDVTEGCWTWTRCKVANGYGRYARNGARDIVYPHRYVVELAQGIDVLDGMHVDHLCRVKACVRPDHLEVVTPGENLRRGLASNEPSGWCRSGRHRWAPENISKSGKYRVCEPCRAERERERSRKRDRRKRAA